MEEQKQFDSNETAIHIEGLCKNYKMFHKKTDRLIEAIIPNISKHDVFSAMQDFNLDVKRRSIRNTWKKTVQENLLY